MSVVIGLAVGMLSGLLGVGGGTILVPVFRLIYGMPAIAATATSLFTIIPTSASGVVTHIRNKTCVPALGLAAGIGGACTSSIGVWLATLSPEWAIMVACALVIGYSALTMFGKAIALWRRQHSELAAPDQVTQPQGHGPASSLAAGLSTRRMVVIGALIGLGAGLVSGYVGVGGGFVMIPLFMQILRTPMKLASGTSLLAVMILAVPATVAQAVLGNIDWVAGLFVAAGTIPGAALGSRLIARVPELALRFGFSGFLLVAAVLLVVNQLNVF